MRQHFEKQLEDATPLEDPSSLNSKSIYSEYQKGDNILVFMELKDGKDLKMCMVTERELGKLEEEYEFLEMNYSFPILKRREK